MRPEALSSIDDPDWLRLRAELWPGCSVAEHREEMLGFLAEPARYAQFIVKDPEAGALGFAEASIRNDYVAGTNASPVGFLEGLYVVPQARRTGVARSLVQAVAAWASRMGCQELASDTQLDNIVSQAVHRHLGFIETERVVNFKMVLPPDSAT